MSLQKIDIAAVIIASVMVAVLAVFFQRTRIGRALRAVADSHQAALSVGISLEQIWVIVWFAAGVVALATGIMWGARSEVSFSLQIIALKALPVLILGGLTSIPGAIVGGLIIGIGEKLGEFYWGPLLGGGIESWLAYVIALGFLVFRPQGLFGEKHHRADLNDALSRGRPVQDELRRRHGGVPDPAGSDRRRGHSLLIAFVVFPLAGNDFVLNTIMIPFLIFALAAIGLNLLTGYTGLLSLGTGAFMGVGAYACLKLTTSFPQVNIIVWILASGFFSAAVGVLVRPAVAAHQGLLSRGGDARGAVLSGMVLHPHSLALQLQRLGRDRGAAAHTVRHPGDRPDRDLADPLSGRARASSWS